MIGDDFMEYKNSYRGLIKWLLWFLVSIFAIPFLPINDVALLTRLSLNVMTLNIVLLMFIIYKTESIYWFNGMPYKDALNAGSEKRKAFAFKHLKFFGLYALFFFVLSVLLHIFYAPFWIDITVCCIGLIVVALSTNVIKL